MILSIVSIIANIAFFVLVKLELFTDHASFPDGSEREYQRSVIDRLEVCDRRELLYLQLFLAAVSIITSILVLCGIKNNIIKVVQLVSSIASLIMFIIIMIVAVTTHPTY